MGAKSPSKLEAQFEFRWRPLKDALKNKNMDEICLFMHTIAHGKRG
jgi:hypothetical protein